MDKHKTHANAYRWLWVYGMLTGVVIVIAFLRSFVFFEANLDAATSIHNLMAKR